MLQEESTVLCPYCGEEITVFVDPGGDTRQTFVTDCDVCCRPIEILATFDDQGALSSVDARRDSAEHF